MGGGGRWHATRNHIYIYLLWFVAFIDLLTMLKTWPCDLLIRQGRTSSCHTCRTKQIHQWVTPQRWLRCKSDSRRKCLGQHHFIQASSDVNNPILKYFKGTYAYSKPQTILNSIPCQCIFCMSQSWYSVRDLVLKRWVKSQKSCLSQMSDTLKRDTGQPETQTVPHSYFYKGRARVRLAYPQEPAPASQMVSSWT